MVATLGDHHKSELVTRSRLVADNRLAHDFVNAVLHAAFLFNWLAAYYRCLVGIAFGCYRSGSLFVFVLIFILVFIFVLVILLDFRFRRNCYARIWPII